jgi:mRNA interferase RelE/StbE
MSISNSLSSHQTPLLDLFKPIKGRASGIDEVERRLYRWQIEFTASAEKELAKMDKNVAKRSIKFLREPVSVDPRSSGKVLKGDHSALWRYQVGYYRVFRDIYDDKISVLVVRLGHRKEFQTERRFRFLLPCVSAQAL